ncbi:MAG TPA: acyltransferase [Flavipsychrobacter sp.]|nr:acyltransferase [Flavipsychrobacter sp.]
MNSNIAQRLEKQDDGWHIEYDWYPKAIPENVMAGDAVYLDSTYSFAGFYSKKPDGMKIGYASGNYLHSHFLVGENGTVAIGQYTILEATVIIANQSVIIGDHCMLSWGSYITDNWLNMANSSAEVRKELLENLAFSENRHLELPECKPVIIENNVWVGFGAVILPGVRLGEGCVVGCKTIIDKDVPPYAVVAGNPARIIRYLKPDRCMVAEKQ